MDVSAKGRVRVRLETKLGLGTGVLIGAMLLTMLSAQFRVLQASRLSDTVTARRLPIILAARDVRFLAQRSTESLEREMLLGSSPERSGVLKADWEDKVHRTTEAVERLDSLAALVDMGEDAARVRRVHGTVDALLRLQMEAERLLETQQPDDLARARELVQTELRAAHDAVSEEATMLSDAGIRLSEQDTEELHRDSRQTVLSLWLITLLGALAGGLISFFVGRRIVQAIDRLVLRANSIAEGDLTGESLQVTTHDQVGLLGEAMNRMQSSLAGIIGTVVDTAGSLTGSAVSMRTASDEIHRRIDEQSQQTQQAATAMQEMSASIAEVSRHTHSAAETAREAAKTAREGGTIVKQMLGTMRDVESGVEQTSRMVGLLGEDSRRISQIVTVIDEIARKTNLLALNAAIEAARAGDHGRGFAVVAGEVRRLAESTAQATGEIAGMIRGIQERTETAIATMEQGTGSVKDGLVTTNEAGEALERIIGMAERVDRMIAQIAIAASQQAAAADQSSTSLDFIHTLSHDNLSEMATTAAGIESLRGTAVTLEKQVDRFHVTHGRREARAA